LLLLDDVVLNTLDRKHAECSPAFHGRAWALVHGPPEQAHSRWSGGPTDIKNENSRFTANIYNNNELQSTVWGASFHWQTECPRIVSLSHVEHVVHQPTLKMVSFTIGIGLAFHRWWVSLMRLNPSDLYI
jgi:hypothetical protein